MEECIKRTINVLKKKSFFKDEYETLEIKEHYFIDSDIEFLNKINNSMMYSNMLKSSRVIYCVHCGQITHKDIDPISKIEKIKKEDPIIKKFIKNKKTKK